MDNGETMQNVNLHSPSDAEYAAYIQTKVDYFLPLFRSFDAVGGNFKVTWSWWVFFTGFWWFLYRKMYLWTVIYIVLLSLSFFITPFVVLIVSSISAKWLYYKDANNSINKIKANLSPQAVQPAIMGIGGVNKWVIPVAIILSGIFMILFIIFFGLIFSALDFQ